MNKINTKISILAIGLFTPIFSLAADKSISANKSGSLSEFLGSIQNWLLGFVLALTTFFIVWGGFQYITSRGNQQQAETAKKTLTYAILGLLFIILAKTIFSIITGDFLSSIFGSDTLTY